MAFLRDSRINSFSAPDDYALTFANNGELLVSNPAAYPAGNIEEYTQSGADLGSFAAASDPHGITADGAGNVYSTVYDYAQIQEFNSSGTLTNTFATGFRPEDVKLDTSSNLLVSENCAGVIEKYSTSGADLGAFATNLIKPDGLTVDGSNGNVYVADGFATLDEYNSSGTLINSVADPNGPIFEARGPASSPVPEASTTVSFGLLLALGMGGLLVARKNNVKG